MSYEITENCIVCRSPYGCIYNCPVHAIHFNGLQAEIDQSLCIKCGKCMSCCYLHAIRNTEAPDPIIAPHDPTEITCDILILGGGASGLTAALRASECTDKKILILEKGKNLGGCGAYSAGLRVFGTAWEKEAGIPDQFDDYVRAAINTTRGLLDPQLIAACYRAIPDFFDWFCEWGDAADGFELDKTGALNGIYVAAKKHDNAGRFITEKMIARCNALGIEYRLETAATDFIVEDGCVVGINASDPGGDLVIHCRAILIATGNLGNSKELHERCVPDFADSYQRKSQHLLPTCTGDGVLMAERAGLPVNLSSIVPSYLGPGCGGPYHPQLMLQPDRADALHVNLDGKRYYNEQQRGEICTWSLLKQPKCVTYTIFDKNLLTSVPVTAPKLLQDPTMGRVISNGVPNWDGTPKTESSVIHLGFGRDMPVDPKLFEQDIQGQVDELTHWQGGYAFKGDTLEELAEQMGVPVDNFLATVHRYNELCHKKHDDDFYKPAELMIPIEQGPFYAFHQFLPTDGTFGGLEVNYKMQLIDQTGTPVTGVYATGDTTGSRYINFGGEKRQIVNDYSWALASGYLAGLELAQYINHLSI